MYQIQFFLLKHLCLKKIQNPVYLLGHTVGWKLLQHRQQKYVNWFHMSSQCKLSTQK